MFFSYGASVVLLSFAILGIWYFFKQLWEGIVHAHSFAVPKISFFILIKNMEQDIEEMLRHIVYEIENSEIECEVIVVDYTSEDLTAFIANRLAKEHYPLISVYGEEKFYHMKFDLLCCDGKIVHIIDMMKKVETQDFIPLVRWLLRKGVD